MTQMLRRGWRQRFCWPRRDVISRAGSRTRHQVKKCAARRVWEYMLGLCTEKCDVGFASSLTWLGVVGLCTKRCEGEFLFVFIWVVDRKTTLRRAVARCVDLLTDGMAVLYVARITNLRCRPAARCVDLLTVGMADFVCGQSY